MIFVDDIEFGETVSAPPILTVIPRKAVKDEQFSKVIKYFVLSALNVISHCFDDEFRVSRSLFNSRKSLEGCSKTMSKVWGYLNIQKRKY